MYCKHLDLDRTGAIVAFRLVETRPQSRNSGGVELEPSQAEHLHALEAQEGLHKKALAELRTTLEEQNQRDAEESRTSTNKEVEALEEELEDKNRQQRQLMEQLQSFQREHEATLEAHQKELASLEVR